VQIAPWPEPGKPLSDGDETQTERAMIGLYIIGAFLAAMLLLNLIDFGRID